jgi:DNA repair protein RadC
LKALKCERIRGDKGLERAIVKRFPQVKCSPHEVLLMASMDAAGCLIGVEKLAEGAPGYVAIYPRAIVEAARSRGAKSVAFAHNHPSGSTVASMEDEVMTHRISAILKRDGVKVDRHIILTKASRGACEAKRWRKTFDGVTQRRR